MMGWDEILRPGVPHDIMIQSWRGTESLVEAAKNGDLKEMFGAGTAAVISPIAGFGYQEKDYDLPELENPFAAQLKKKITDIQTNKVEDPYGWRVFL